MRIRNIKKDREYGLEYYKKNREKILAKRRGNKEFLNKRRPYAKRWREENKDKLAKLQKDWRGTPGGIYYSLSQRKPPVKISFTKEEFIEWHRAQIQKCVYCGTTNEQIKKLKEFNRFSTRLSIDRKDSSRGYEMDNICLCCFMCNTVKNNYLTYDEMLIVGNIILRDKVNKLLNTKP